MLKAGVNIRATALKEFWSNEYPHSLYLWEGAKHSRPLGEIENDPVPTHEDMFSSQAQIQTGHDFCRLFYEKSLLILAATLNKIHGLNLSESFWRISFGQWLYRHIVVAYDKFVVLKQFDIDNVSLQLLDQQSFFIPKDHYEYLWCFGQDFGVQQLVSQYLYLFSRKQFPTIKKSAAFQPIDFCNLAETEGNTCPDIALMGVFLSGDAYNLLTSRSGGKIGNLGLPKIILPNDKIDIASRKLFIDAANGDSFESYFFHTLCYCLPKDFLENFKTYYNSFERDLDSKNFRHLVVEAWISHIPSAIYAGLAKERNRKVISYEHGSGTAFYRNSPARLVDLEACDRYISVGWGKTGEKFVKGGFAVRDIRPYNPKSEKSTILYITRTKSPYQTELNEATIAYSSFVKELRIVSDFVDLLPAVLRDQFVLRPRGKDIFFWDTEATLEVEKRKIAIDRSTDFAKNILQAKIIVIDHISTGIAELILMGAPFILLHAVSKIASDAELKQIFDELRACGVIHETAKSAIMHLMAVYDDVQGWWQSDKVRSALEKLRNFALAPASNFTDYILSLLTPERETRDEAAFNKLSREEILTILL
jgi:putative transferase (TIGR04331 family)